MCLDNLSGCELVGLASVIAISLADGLSSDQVSTLGNFFTALGDNLSLLSNKIVDKNSTSCKSCSVDSSSNDSSSNDSISSNSSSADSKNVDLEEHRLK